MLSSAELGNPKTAREVEIAERFWNSLELEAEFARAFYFGLPESDRVRTLIGNDWDFYQKWMAGNRRRIVLAGEQIQERLTDSAEVLEVGCSSGQVGCEIARHGHRVTGIDLSERSIEIGQTILPELNLDVKIQTGDALNLSFEDESFDAVVSWDVVEHIPDQSRFLGEIYRVLRPGGIVLLHTDNDLRIQIGVWARRMTCWLKGHNPLKWRHSYAGLEGGHCALVTPRELEQTALKLGYTAACSEYRGGWSLAPGSLTAPKFIFEAQKPQAVVPA